jgi:hypothetical protein
MDMLYEENSVSVFILVTLILGGGASVLAGRAIAMTWRPGWQVVVYMLILGLAVRFIHFSLFGGTLLSLHYYLVDSAFCMAFGFLGFRKTRILQMVQHYRWLYEPYGPVRWRRKPR